MAAFQGSAFEPSLAHLPLTLAEAVMLISWWKAILLLAPFAVWGRLVSSVFDKHAARFFLGRDKWALAHMGFGFAAAIVGFFMPIPAWWGFFVAFLAVVGILGADVFLFVTITNKHENVPQHARLKIDMSKFAEARAQKEAARKAATVTLTIKTAGGETLAPPQKDTPEFEVRASAEQLFVQSKLARAYQIEVLPTAKEGVYGIRMLVDGVWQAGEQVPAAEAIKMIDFWKSCAGLDVSDRRRKLAGKCTVSRDDLKTIVRVVSSGVRGGMRLNLAFDVEKAVIQGFKDLGLLDPQLAAFENLPEGHVVLLGAPPLQGATTTLYAAVKTHDAYTKNVQTVEMDLQAPLEGVRQLEYKPGEDGAEYATTFRSIVRRDPDVVGVAEIPDADTAKEIAVAESERVRIYVSLRADNALAAVQMFVKATGSSAQASKGLGAAMAQKLCRKLCENCRVPYQPPPQMVQKLGLPADKVKQLFKKGGQVLVRNKPETCPVCGGSGFDGQIGLFELFPIGPEERQLIADQDWQGLRAAWRKHQLPSIQQVALRRAVEGVTSVEEITRVTAPPKPKAPPKGGGGQPSAPKPVTTG